MRGIHKSLRGLNADSDVERITIKPVSLIAGFSYEYQDLLFTPADIAQ